MPPVLYLIDGHALAYRTYFALATAGERLQTRSGEPTAGIYGFCSVLLKILEQDRPDYLAVAFDTGKTFRNDLYPDYKATRAKMPDDLRAQIERLRQIVDAFNLPRLEKEGVEADDVLGSIAKQAVELGLGVKIITGDRDLLQLVQERVIVNLAGNKLSDARDFTAADVIETLGVRPDAKGRNVGGRLLDALSAVAVKRGIRELRTAARWNNHAMLRWFGEHGFVLAPNHVVERAIDATAIEAPVDAPVSVESGRGPGFEIDYGAPGDNDYERLARDTCDVRAMSTADLAEIVRIDRGLTGHDRSAYIGRKLAEAMTESGVRVSLAARLDGAVVGFVMARADLGDFGRTDPTAVLDTIGVDREYEHQGIGHALLSQLFLNLAALRIDRVETVVAPRDLALLGFLYDVGFEPSQRIPFVRALG